MKIKGLYILLVIVLPVIVIVALRIISSRLPKEGEIRIESSQDASVFIDNKSYGKTAFQERMTAGEYSVKIVPESLLDGLVPWQGKVTVAPGRLTYVKADLASSDLLTAVHVLWLEKSSSKNGEITVVANPDGAAVSVDDSQKGNAPLTIADLSSGDHVVLVSSVGFLPRTIKVKTIPGYKVNASVKLSLLPVKATTQSENIIAEPTPTTALSKNAQFIIISDTPTGFLRVRFEPTLNASESGRVKPNEKFVLIEEKDSWYKIEFESGQFGWISNKYAKKTTQ